MCSPSQGLITTEHVPVDRVFKCVYSLAGVMLGYYGKSMFSVSLLCWRIIWFQSWSITNRKVYNCVLPCISSATASHASVRQKHWMIVSVPFAILTLCLWLDTLVLQFERNAIKGAFYTSPTALEITILDLLIMCCSFIFHSSFFFLSSFPILQAK